MRMALNRPTSILKDCDNGKHLPPVKKLLFVILSYHDVEHSLLSNVLLLGTTNRASRITTATSEGNAFSNIEKM
jgi:hypothetical protein